MKSSSVRAAGPIRVLVASLAAVALMLVGIVVPGGAAANAADGATVTVDPSTVSLLDYLDSGVEVTGTGFPASAEVTVTYFSPFDTVMSDAEGNVSYHLQRWGPPAGTYDVILASGDVSASASLTVEPMPPASVSVSPASLTQSELASSGLTITGENYYPHASNSVLLDGEYVASAPSGTYGAVEQVLTFTDVAPGEHTLQLGTYLSIAETTFTVTADPVADPTVTLNPSTVTLPDFVNDGVQVTGTGFPASAPVDVTYRGVVSTVTSDADGNVSYTLMGWGSRPGTLDVTLTSGEVSASASLTVEMAGPTTLTATPGTVTQSELTGPGIRLTGENFYPSAVINIVVDGEHLDGVASDSDGSFSELVPMPGLTIGEHTVAMSSGALPGAEATFTVVADPVYDPSVTVSPGSLGAAEFWDTGVTADGAGFPRDADVVVSLDGVEQATVPSDAAGDAFHVLSAMQPSAGAHTITMTSGDVSASVDFTIQAPSAVVTPASRGEAAFARSGITVTAGTFYPGRVYLSLDGERVDIMDVDRFGSVVRTQHALPGEVLGEHTVAVTSDDQILAALTTFTITETTVAVEPGTVTIPALADAGVTVSGAGWPTEGAEVDVLIDGASVGTAAPDETGNVSYALTQADVAPGVHEVTLATDEWTETTELTVAAPVASVTPDTVSLPEFVNSGAQVSGSGFPAETEVDVSFATEVVATVESDADGNVSYTLSEQATAPGEYEVTLASGDLSASASLTVEAVGPTSVTVDPDSVTPAQLADPGVTVTGENFFPGAPVAISVDGVQVVAATADEAGAVETILALPDYAQGEYTVIADDGVLPAAETTLVVTPDPHLSLDPSTVTVSEFAEDGVVVAGTVFPISAPVEVRLDGDLVDTVESDGAGDVSYTLVHADAAPGTHEVTLVSGGWTATATLEVFDPAVTVSPETLTVSELATDGVDVSGSGFPALTPAEVLFDGDPVADDGLASFGLATMADETTDADGNLSVTVTQGAVTPGDHEVTVRAGGIAASALVTVTADPVYEPSVTLSPDEISAADLPDEGVEVTGTGYPADSEATITVDGESAATATTDGTGTVAHLLEGLEWEAGSYVIGVSVGDVEAEATLTVTAVPDPTPSPDPAPSPDPGPSPSPAPAPNGQLPATGDDAGAVIWWGAGALMLMLAGLGLIAWRRRVLN